MRILIYGGGAVGLGLASFLLKSQQEVTIIARKNTVTLLKKEGLKRSGIFGAFHAHPKDFSCYTKLDQLPPAIFDYILVSTKSFDSKAAAEDLALHTSLWDKNMKIVLCQNGWGNAEIFAALFPKKQIFNARIITGFTRIHPNQVNITVHAEPIHIGSLFHQNLDGVKSLCQAINDGGIPCEPFPEIAKDLWAKMLYNCALNPLGAVLQVSYGALGQSPFTRALMNKIIEEIYEVMNKNNYTTHWASPFDYLKIFYEKFLPATAGHHSSTLQSLKAGKQTEIDALTGIVITLAEKQGIDVPVNRALYQMVKFSEKEGKG